MKRDRGCVNHEYAGGCVQAQRKTEEREERRKGRYPAGSVAWAWDEESHDCHLMQMKRYPDRDDL